MQLAIRSQRAAHVRSALPLASATALMVLAARIEIPFFPVPFTLQTLVVVLSGWYLGRQAMIAQVSYLGLGLAGVPVFAQGKVGLATLMGPTGGYLIGFIAAAGLIGWLSERGAGKTLLGRIAATAAGLATILTLGFAYLATQVGAREAWLVGVAPFLLAEVVKLFAAQCLLATKTNR